MYPIRTRYFPFLLPLFLFAQAGTARQVSSTPPSGTPGGKLLFEENFDHPLDSSLWKVELQPSPGSSVIAKNGSLLLKTGAGITVWLNKKLSGNLVITYSRKVVMENGAFDRLSDFNQFWMAVDPRKTNLFTRTGKLEEYDSLKLYYVGMGGNTNSTTRFRRYDGKGTKELIGELLDAPHLLQPNVWYAIQLMVNNGEVSYWVNGERYFSYHDPAPLTSGYFGFRSTKSNQEIKGLKIYQLR